MWLAMFGTAILAVGLAVSGAMAQPVELRVVGTQPPAHALDASPDAAIEVRFDRAVDRSSVDAQSFWAIGRWSGPVTGSISFAAGDSAIRITPELPLSAGERVMVVLSRGLRGADGAPMRGAGYSFRYWTRSVPTAAEFDLHVQLSTGADPTEETRAYGGFAANLNDDRMLDLGIVNEVTADVRVFLNRGQGEQRFDSFLQPPAGVGPRASPSETSDFDRDGKVDVCVANIDAGTVSILMGRGDGTFDPQQVVGVGLAPRGITVLDMDGDGDIDIACTNSGSNDVSLLFNDGTGEFAIGLQIDAGGDGEWAIEAADMNDDGILDLVVGCQQSETVHVNLGVGSGLFQEVDSSPSGGSIWMLNCGDVNGDGHEDVVVINSHSSNAAVLVGDGKGQLGDPITRRTDPFPLASDLGDFDGDGDLDWVTSSFDGDWVLSNNQGDGTFQFQRRFTAPRAASCAIPFDMDDDGDLDLALVDEIADVVLVYENGGTPTPVKTIGWSELKALFRKERP